MLNLNSLNIDEIVNLASHESLSDLAYKRYGDTKLWRTIADANEEYNIFDTSNTTLKIILPTKEKAISIFKEKLSDEINSLDNTIGKVGQLPHQVIDWIL